ncbi:hypothetical protein F0562_014509 [Nyssa sinensis]|uniref:Uncharacterized protein n=1 Tax=Nyssa sinensis TaxID=561372 RepID=A0A5J4ZN01_9ASTE|nr:hypothetical protein F0562_014509 [Nyssa sinensis]
MALAYNFLSKPSNVVKIKLSSNSNQKKPQGIQVYAAKRCLRCNTLYQDKDNSPTACSFHGHTTGEKGLLALAPPHQGIDGEWSDRSGVIVYKWNEKIIDQTLEVPTGKRDGAVVLSMVKTPHLVEEDGMSRMMMASLYISHIQIKFNTRLLIQLHKKCHQLLINFLLRTMEHKQ